MNRRTAEHISTVLRDTYAAGGKIYLNVPYSEKDAAKLRGARWDAQRKKWYVLQSQYVEDFKRWMDPA